MAKITKATLLRHITEFIEETGGPTAEEVMLEPFSLGEMKAHELIENLRGQVMLEAIKRTER